MKKIGLVILGALFMLTGCAAGGTKTPPAPEKSKEPEPTVSASPAPSEPTESQPPIDIPEIVVEQLKPVKEGEEIAIMTTSLGDIKIRFFPEYAPKAVENFKTHAKNGYYNGIVFHRVINDFMIQGGDPTATGKGGESIFGQAFEDEFTLNLRHFRGALSMANAGDNTNGSQFFIVQNKKLSEGIVTDFEKFKTNQEDVVETLPDGTELKIKNYFPTEIVDKYLQDGGTPSLDYKHTIFGHVISGMEVVDAIAAVKTTNDKPDEDVVIKSITFEPYKG